MDDVSFATDWINTNVNRMKIKISCSTFKTVGTKNSCNNNRLNRCLFARYFVKMNKQWIDKSKMNNNNGDTCNANRAQVSIEYMIIYIYIYKFTRNCIADVRFIMHKVFMAIDFVGLIVIICIRHMDKSSQSIVHNYFLVSQWQCVVWFMWIFSFLYEIIIISLLSMYCVLLTLPCNPNGHNQHFYCSNF